MVFNLELETVKPQLDCKRKFGNDQFTFYSPIEIGDFVVMLWTRNNVPDDGEDWYSKKASKYQLNISSLVREKFTYSATLYENGALVSKDDQRLANFSWSTKLERSWCEEVFEKTEVEQMLKDLAVIASMAA